MDNTLLGVFMGLWLFCCFICVGFSFYTFTEGNVWTFLLSLLFVPFGPITVAYQWATFHGATNKNLYLLADSINNNLERLRNSEKPIHGG
jgi:hypothetical protein